VSTAGKITVILATDLTQYSGGLTKASNQLAAFGKRIDHVSAGMTRMGKSLAMKVTAPIVAGLGFGLKQYANFDQAMTESFAIMDNVTDAQKKAASDLAKTLSMELAFSADQLAGNYFNLFSAGMDVEDGMKNLKGVAQFAMAGMFDLATATKLAADAQSSMGLKVGTAAQKQKNLIRIMDVLVKANKLATTTTEEIAEALASGAGAEMRKFNIPLEEGVAVLAAFAEQGKKGKVAGEGFTITLRGIQKAAAEGAPWVRKLVYDINTGKLLNMADIVDNFTGALSGLSNEAFYAKMRIMGFTEESDKWVSKLIGIGPMISRFEGELWKAGGTAEKVANEQLKSFTNQMVLLWNTIKVLAIEMGEVLVPSIIWLRSKIQNAAIWFWNLTEGMKKFIVFAALIAASVGPALILLGGLGFVLSGIVMAFSTLAAVGASVLGFFAFLVTPVGMLVIGLTALGVILAYFLVDWKNLGKAISDTFKKSWESLKTFATNTAGFFFNFRENWAILTKWIDDNWDQLMENMRHWTVAFFKMLLVNAKTIVENMSKLFAVFAGWLADNFPGWAVAAMEGAVNVVADFFDWLEIAAKKIGTSFWDWITGRSTGSFQDWIDNSIKDFLKAFTATGSLAERIQKADLKELRGAGEFFQSFQALQGPEFNLSFGKSAEKLADALNNIPSVVDDIAMDGIGGVPSGEGATNVLSGALERGSAEAFEASFRGRNTDQKIEENTKTSARESVKQTALLEDMVQSLEGLDLETVSIG